MKNRGGLRRFGKPWRTVANRGGLPPPRTEQWRRGAVRGANRTVGVAHGSICERTAPRGSRFEPWSTLYAATVKDRTEEFKEWVYNGHYQIIDKSKWELFLIFF